MINAFVINVHKCVKYISKSASILSAEVFVCNHRGQTFPKVLGPGLNILWPVPHEESVPKVCCLNVQLCWD